ncbi:hypothetical protein MUG87_08825 [Ectobacillus sp. JY-23]|uniref:hypothetical protein n=1 Tax=Ectobacillus sp. JY-23 TaxID=2933872 RepID=UPI001FF22868|nr:hypothetical protein [Ectobacillus sp. JY-23]UOY94185.1 hypothetical protein MUG87_08825 [Ectobacillus sp. JY-23]
MRKLSQNYFFCYSKQTMKFLRYGKGIPFITYAIHGRTGIEFWLFERNPKLDEALQEIG